MIKNGWGMKEFIILLCCLGFCLTIVIILGNKLKHGNVDVKNNMPIEFGGTSDTIKNYIEIEDKIANAAKNYKIEETEDTVIIKLDKLIENGYINIVKDPKNNKKCSGYVIYTGTNKEYKAYLSCSGNYQTSDYNVKFE